MNAVRAVSILAFVAMALFATLSALLLFAGNTEASGATNTTCIISFVVWAIAFLVVRLGGNRRGPGR